MRTFDVPKFYKSQIISQVKNFRKTKDPRKKDFTPTILDFGPIRFFLARHFGFCYGVENAIEIAYQTLEKYPDRRIFFLSEMIHNPNVNADLQSRGIQFIMTTKGKQLIEWSELKSDDIVLIPAFGTTVEIHEKLKAIGVTEQAFDTTCPFVEKVWKRADKLGDTQHTIIVHGKPDHEETRATFSHSTQNAQTLVIRDIEEAKILADLILGRKPIESFFDLFKKRYSKGFDPKLHLNKIGVVNQTTMLASETQEIASFLRQTMIEKHGEEQIKNHFADTRDTLCYATNDNQQATYGLLEHGGDMAFVVGGYNSSNTTHLVELCKKKLPTYFINGPENLLAMDLIRNYNIYYKEELTTTFVIERNNSFAKEKIDILVTSGASCPDALVEAVLLKYLSFFENTKSIEEVMAEYQEQ